MEKFLVCVRTHYMFMIMTCTNDRHMFIYGCLQINVLKVLFLFSVVHPWTDLLFSYYLWTPVYMRQKTRRPYFGLDNGVSPIRHQAIIWSSAGLLLCGKFATEIWVEIHQSLHNRTLKAFPNYDVIMFQLHYCHAVYLISTSINVKANVAPPRWRNTQN